MSGKIGRGKMKNLQVDFLPLILGIFMFSFIFLPWVSVDLGIGVSETANGIEDGWGILSMIMSIICILLSFVNTAKIKGIGLMTCGVFGIIGVIAYWFNVRGELGIFKDLISPNFGLIITALVATGVIITGLSRYRRSI